MLRVFFFELIGLGTSNWLVCGIGYCFYAGFLPYGVFAGYTVVILHTKFAGTPFFL